MRLEVTDVYKRQVLETQPTSEMEVATNNTLENQQEGTLPAEPEQPRQTEGLTQIGNANFLEMMRAIMEETLNRNNASINKKLESLKAVSYTHLDVYKRQVNRETGPLMNIVTNRLCGVV